MGSVAAAPRPQRTGSIVVVHGLSCSTASWDLPKSGVEPVSPAVAGGFFTPSQQGSPSKYFLRAYMLDTVLGSIDFSFGYGIYILKERNNQ